MITRIQLKHSELVNLAENKEIPTHVWASFMQDSRQDREFFNARFKRFQSHRSFVEYSVKAAVSMTLGVGLFLASPAAALIGGAALTLSLSTAIFSQIHLHKHEIVLDDEVEEEFEDCVQAEWEEYRKEWSLQARHHDLSAKQITLHTNMNRIGLGLVMGFACFTAISSGVAIPLAIATVLYSASLFYTRIDEPEPYLEENLPSFS